MSVDAESSRNRRPRDVWRFTSGFLQDRADPLPGGPRPDEHGEDCRDHVQGEEDLGHVVDERNDLADLEVARRDAVPADPQDRDDPEVDGQRDCGAEKRHCAQGVCRGPRQLGIGARKALHLPGLLAESLHHAYAAQVLAGDRVHAVKPFLYPAEPGEACHQVDANESSRDRHGDDEDNRQTRLEDDRHDQPPDSEDGRLGEKPHDSLDEGLNLRDVIRLAGDEGGSVETVQFLEREGGHPLKEVGAEAGPELVGHDARDDVPARRADRADSRYREHLEAEVKHERDVSRRHTVVDDVGHDCRLKEIGYGLDGQARQRGQERPQVHAQVGSGEARGGCTCTQVLLGCSLKAYSGNVRAANGRSVAGRISLHVRTRSQPRGWWFCARLFRYSGGDPLSSPAKAGMQ